MDHNICDTRFVLHRQKDESQRCTRTLAGNHTSGSADVSPVRLLLEFPGREHAHPSQFRAPISHRMWPSREARSGVIRDKPFFIAHHAQRRTGRLTCCFMPSQQGTNRAAHLLDLPDGIASMPDIMERVKRANTCELRKVASVQYRDPKSKVFDILKHP